MMKRCMKYISMVCITVLISATNIQAQDVHHVAAAGDLDKMRELLEENLTLLNLKDNNGFTPLHHACQNKQVEVANYLLNKGADVNIRDNYLQTPLSRACQVNGQDVYLIQCLIDKGATVNSQGYNGITPLHWAAKSGSIDIAKLLIDNGADVNINEKYTGSIGPSSISGSILEVAINYCQKEEMAILLVTNKAKLNNTDSFGNTELHIAALKGFDKLAKCLIEQGADIDAVNTYNRTALYYASKHGYRHTADVLIAAGANQSFIVESNYGNAPQLTEKLKNGEAYLWYLYGYAIKTKGHLLLPNPDNITQLLEADLSNGHLNPSELSGQKVTVLLTYLDYQAVYFESNILELSKKIPDINFISGSRPIANNDSNPDFPTYHQVAPNENLSVDDIQIHAVPAMGNGTGYLIEIDGLKILYSGYHTAIHNAIQQEKYRQRIDSLKSFGQIDIAVLNIKGHIGVDFAPDHYLLDQLSPKSVYLMGANIKEDYPKCSEALQIYNIPIFFPEGGRAKGERFYYQQE